MKITQFTHPTNTQLLLLHACLSPDAHFAESLRRWEMRQELDSIDVGSLRLLPFLSRRIETLGTPARDRGRIKGVYLKNWFEQQTRQTEVRETLVYLQERGLSPIVLKGYALAQIAYRGESPIRPSADLDVLVDSPDLDSAVTHLTSVGYRAPIEYAASDHNAGLKSMGLRHPLKQLEVDIHIRIMNFCADPRFHDRIKDRAVELQIVDIPVLTLCSTDHLLHTLIHGSGANEVPSIRWIVDAAQLINQSEIDWVLFAREVAACKLRTPIVHQLQYLVQEFDLPIPLDVIEVIKESPSSLAGMLMQFRASLTTRRSMRLARATFAEYLARPATFEHSHFWIRYPLANIPVLAGVVQDYTKRRARMRRIQPMAKPRS